MHLIAKLAAATALAAAALPAWSATTQNTGSGEAFANYQPALALNELIEVNGIFPSTSDGGIVDFATFTTIGMVRHFTGAYSPGTTAAGQARSIADFSSLFAVIGNSYGGNESVYNLPDLRRTTIVGAASPSGQGAVNGYLSAQQTGTQATVLTVDQLPAHTHTLPGGGVTDATGAGTAFDQRQPSLSMTYLIAANGFFPGNGSAVSTGQIAAFAGSFVPQGWRPADGSLLLIDDYLALHSIIGTTYGGDGITTFALPDLRGRAIVGAGSGPGVRAVALGEQFGSDTTTLSAAQLPAHNHGLTDPEVTGSTGANAPVDQYQASIGLNYIISLEGIFPANNSALDPEIASIGEIVAWTGNFAPDGWAFADGSLVNIASNSALYSIIGTIYGGDGSQTFALPDLRGRTIIGAGAGVPVGTRLGNGGTTLFAANLPAHAHDYDVATAIPEPGTWALMLIGFGAVGLATRRRQTAAVA